MRNNCLPLTIFLVAFSSQLPIARAFDLFRGNISYNIGEAVHQQKLHHETIPEIKAACLEAVKVDSDRRLRALTKQLMLSLPAKNSFGLEIERAEALLVCKAPANAQEVLNGIMPTNGTQQKMWSILFWQASNAVMDHSSASLALRRLSEGNLQNLDQELITVGYGSDGSPLKRVALDLLAEHERLIGRCEFAARILLAGRKTGALGARRLSRAAQCLEDLSIDKRKDLLESALSKAKSDQAWWLVGDILRLQLMLDLALGESATSVRKRLEDFSKELDDRYTQLELIRSDADRQQEKILFENQLRSPRETASDTEKAPL